MSTFKVTLEIDTVGDKQAMAALDTLAAKSRTASTGTSALGAEATKTTRAVGEHRKEITKISRAMETLATETLGAKSQFGLMGAELAKMTLGGAWVLGITAGIAAIGLAYDKLTEKSKAAKQAQEELRAKIAEAANAGQADVIAAEARKIQFGQPFDKDGKLVANSRFVTGAFAGSLLDVQAQLADAQNRFYSESDGFAQIAIQKQIIKLKAQLAPMEATMAALRSAGANVASQPAENAGRLATITTTATGPGGATGQAGASVAKALADAYQKELAQDMAAATKIAVAQGVEAATLSGEARAGILDGLLPTKEQMADAINGIGQQISDAIENDPILIRGKMGVELGKQIGSMIVDGLASSIAQALHAGFQEAFSGKGAVGFIQGFGKAVLGALGGVMEQMGTTLMSFGLAMTLVSHAFKNPITSGPALIAAGAILAGLGAALEAAVQGGGGGGASYSGGAGGSGLGSIIDRGIIDPDTYSSRSTATLTPRGGDTYVFYGANDPQAVRWLDEMDRKRQQRGSLVPARA